ncbi:uracil-DNA glycosylase [Neokomagataea anthophila]|uniref:Uracil-DNA glycosylase n=1 Tax=Neokomagataea anthophila TaxID=2826925 RepID=A0ABS5E7X4_9PROT|nr:uracil-DNA glycosylase [Neokomagataea anthophila]MBR0559997.1 uracil-DNA glycosylase [Neokomagataea anthophila]
MTPDVIQRQAEYLAALTLLRDWGADEALLEAPQDRFAEVESAVQAARSDVTYEGRASVRGGGEAPRAVERSVSARGVARQGEVEKLSETAFLARMATHHLKPIYAENAPVMLIGEVPDAEEDRTGSLFAGESGLLLDRMLASIGVARSALSQVPSVPWRPPGGRPVSASEMKACLPLLQEAIREGRPQRIVTLGVTPLRMLCGAVMLGRMRGRWTSVTIPGLEEPIPVFPMHHPVQLRVGAPMRRKTWEDLLSLREHLEKAGVL